MSAQTRRVDVVIVGAGPTGLTAAALCARVGLSAVVLELRPGPQRSPAAHVVNARTFEIWRQAGLDMEPILAACLQPEEADRVHWVTKLGGDVIGSLPFERQGDEMLAVTPTPIRNLSQHRLEPLLLSAELDVRYGHAWTSTIEQPNGVRVTVDGPDGGYELDAGYLLAADGAASGVRRALGIEMAGPRTIQSFVMIHLRADFRSLVGGAVGVLYFLIDPLTGGTFVSHGIDREWVYMHGWNPEVESVDAFTPDRCAAMVAEALADPSAPFEVLDVSTWHMSAQIADAYRDGRTFLVGDAAHRFPPTGGLGLNTGVADVHNLVWKLAAVESGRAEESILETYEAERRPVAQFNCDQSLHNALNLAEVPKALGLTRDVQASVRALRETLDDPERRFAVDAAIAGQAVHFDLLGLQLGHRYDGPLVIDDGTEAPVVDDPAREYVPSARPGGRLPHGWLEPGISTLDLVDVRLPTVLVREGVEPPPSELPAVVHAVAAAVWDATFAIPADTAIIVRPDQHVAARCRTADVAGVLGQLFPMRQETAP